MLIFGVIIQILFFAVGSYGIPRLLSTTDILALNWTERLSFILTMFGIFVPYFFSISILHNMIAEEIIDDLIPEYKAIAYTILAEIFIICAAAGLRM